MALVLEPAAFLRRTEPLQDRLIAVAFWASAVMALVNLRNLHLWGMPQVKGVIAGATMASVVLLVGLVGIRRLLARSQSDSPETTGGPRSSTARTASIPTSPNLPTIQTPRHHHGSERPNALSQENRGGGRGPRREVPNVNPKPASVRHNDWRSVAVEPLDTFTPTMPVSVIIPSYQTPDATLAMLLASLEGQTYPRELFEVIVVDDGSEPPERPRSGPLDVKIVRQERCGFGTSRARNNGVRAAAHDVLLFLDSDMLVEADWMVAHARWHHAVSDALTLGSRSHVAVGGIDAETIRRRAGTLKELFSDRPVTPPWTEIYMARSNDLTSRTDDPFKVMIGGNFGISKGFYCLVGGMEESFTRWGTEDTEFGYRAYTRGGLMVPVRDACAWHQGGWEEGRDSRRRARREERRKAAHLIAHDSFRKSRPGRIFKVPQYVVTIDAGHHPADRIIDTTENILADRVHDLVVRIEMRARDDTEPLAWLQDEFAADPRVRIAPTCSALDEFPASPFHVTLPVAPFARGLVHRLRVRLGDAATAAAKLPDGSTVSITRAWALHRARRARCSPPPRPITARRG